MFATLPDQTRIYYNINGTDAILDIHKPVLIVLHGGPGISDHTMYQPFWSKLQNVIQVVLIDMRGHGKSDGRDSPEKWTLQQWGRDVYDFCQVCQIQKPIIAAVSFGGWVALSYAIQFPTHPAGLILCHTEAKIEKEIRKEAYRRKAIKMKVDPNNIANIVQQIFDWAPGVDTKALYINHCVPLYSTSPYKPEEFAACIRNPLVWDTFGRAQHEFDFMPQLNKITAPTLVITGEDDPEHPPETAEILANHITGARLIIMKDTGVPVYREREAETLTILADQINTWLG
jgi:proline iminopeptidase